MLETKEEKAAREKRVLAWLGAGYVSQGVLALIENSSNEELAVLFYRHALGDWGLVPDEDRQSNDHALRNNERVISSYLFAGIKILIITEADRSRTTALLPSEY